MTKIYHFKQHLGNLRVGRRMLVWSVFCCFFAFSEMAVAQDDAGAYMVLQNMDNFPANDQLTFSRIEIPWRRENPVTPYNANHDRVRLRIYSKGVNSLAVSNLTLSNPGAWSIVSVGGDTSPSYPVTVGVRAFSEVVIEFNAADAATRAIVFHDTLTITSNDKLTPSKKVVLHGLYQRMGEGRNEPYAQEMINAFGFTTGTGYNSTDGTIEGKNIVPNSDEVAASYFVRANSLEPIRVYQLAAYHSCCTAVETFEYFKKGTNTPTALFTHNPLDGQSLSPRLRNSSTNLAHATLETADTLGFLISKSSSDRTKNAGGIIGMRFLKAVDARGNIIPNAYFVNHDYIDVEFTNYDYQDNMYYVENVKPAAGSVHFSTLASLSGSALYFNPTAVSSTTTQSIRIKNQGNTYSDNSSDPNIQIRSIRIIGPNGADFSVSSSSSTLTPQQELAFDVRFAPKSQGIKNAVLVVYYDNALSPLRIPLYGNANTQTAVVEVVKRIKGGADNPVTIAGEAYEGDAAYRTGSVRNDAQVIPSDVAGTDRDALYQTYLSAATDLASTGYNIPLANGNYMIRMHFVENYFPSQGSRVFSTTIEGTRVLANLDIFNEVGYRTAIVKDFNVTVSDENLNILYSPTVNRLAIGGLEIFRMNSNPLPVTLVNFSAKKEAQTAVLSWLTSAETNSKEFEIQRSRDGLLWNTISIQAAQGESVSSKHYDYVDAEPVQGANLYRLKMVDHDNTFAYSRIESLEFDLQDYATVFPNPAADKLTLRVKNWSDVASVQLFNALGTAVYAGKNTDSHEIDIKKLPAGFYVVHVIMTDGTVVTHKIVKN